ncbi:DUF4401 domain-containing protein [Pusillimonas caeni]|uniref:GDYXXLXY domain-containing protein n=1 Tax=Pusillimonas caeni TaxID=1348472 RepID=UPI000E59DE02|nr:GDYXXLXY domain-containing protein [Pusillimonas caeni]TFL11537.1 DUF4401 domain-containing protein [Pusillimonas caeni]
MTEGLRDGSRGEGRRGFIYRAGTGLACLLLASAGVCWVAANWEHASNLQKLAGAQMLLAVLVLAAVWRARPGSEGRLEAGNRNFTAAAHLAGLAGVATGALLALIGQIYQTGADAWQLFLAWAALLIPWLLTQHTVFLGLLFAVVLNTALGLYLGVHDGGIWRDFGGWTSAALLAALLNAVLLAAWERCIAYFDDGWRIGPRILAMAVAGWLVAAAFAGIDSRAGPIGISILGWAVLATMYLAYTRLRSDLAIVSLAALAAFVLLVLPLLYWVGSEAGLLLVVVVLLAAMAMGLRKLGQLLRARALADDPWYVSAFRLVAMGITAVLLIVFLLITLDFQVETLWVPGLLLCLAGLAAYRRGGADVLRELGLTSMTAGLLLSGGSFFALHEDGSGVAVYALLALGLVLYVLAGNAAFRFIAAFFVLGMATVMTWPHGNWEDALFDAGHALRDAPLSAYLRMWWFSLAGVLVLLLGRGEQAGRRWRPLGWALVFLAQITVWQTPAPQPGSIAQVWRFDPSVVVIWLACAALPVAALGAVVWRKPALPPSIRLGAPLALAIAAVGWMGAPGVSLALLWLIIGFAMRHRSLMGFGVLALLAYLMHFYYLLDSTLLNKSFVLGATGAWLLASAWVLRRVHRKKAQRDAAFTAAGPAEHSAAVGADAGGAERVGGIEHAEGSASSAGRSGAALRFGGMASRFWRRGGLIAGLLIVLAAANAGIYQREQILARGQRVVLELAPVDPRSLMQGDYMRLNFDVANKALSALGQAPDALRRDIGRRGAGLLVLRPDERGVHGLVAIRALSNGTSKSAYVASGGSPVQPAGSDYDDVFLEFRLRGSQVRVVTDAWFFPEGQAARFERARYGEFRVDQDGAGLLTGLLDERLRPLSGR